MSAGRYAIVENGTVVNVVIWDGDTTVWQPPKGTTANLLPDDSPVSPGWTFDGTNYAPPATAAP